MTDADADSQAADSPERPGFFKRWGGFLIRWTVAIVGIVWVVNGLTLRDRAYVLVDDAQGQPLVLDIALAAPFEEGRPVVYYDPSTDEAVHVPAEQLVSGPDPDTLATVHDGVATTLDLAAMRLEERPDARRGELPQITRVWAFTPDAGDAAGRVFEVPVDEWAGRIEVRVPQPLVRTGLISMVRDARPWVMALAFAVFPITLVSTGLRWWRLMEPLGIAIGLRRAFVLNLVGLFYNSFMLGNTGGDVIKAFYAARHAGRGKKTAAWLSVFVDRVIGLIVLLVMGGLAAGIQYAITADRDSAVSVACLQVATVSAALLTASALGAFVLMHGPTRRVIRRRAGIDKVIEKTEPSSDGLRGRVRGKVREGVHSTFDVLDAYVHAPRRVVEACLLTVPVHGAVIVASMLAGVALGLPIPWPYYFVCVPVIVLSGSIPISPQGAGVMEFFAVLLTRPQGATVAQAFVLALCIRALHIFWNLAGGVFVFRGGYSQPTEADPDALSDPDANPGHAGNVHLHDTPAIEHDGGGPTQASGSDRTDAEEPPEVRQPGATTASA